MGNTVLAESLLHVMGIRHGYYAVRIDRVQFVHQGENTRETLCHVGQVGFGNSKACQQGHLLDIAGCDGHGRLLVEGREN